MQRSQALAKGYPYKIIPFPADSKISKHPVPYFVNHFFLIEALLRSETVKTAYRQDPQQFRSLLEKRGIPFDPLVTPFHPFICFDTTTRDEEFDKMAAWYGCVTGAVTDLTVAIKHGPSEWWPKGGMAEILQQLRNPDPRFLYFRLDVSNSARAILRTLHPLLAVGHKRFMKTPAVNPLDRFYKDQTPFGNIKAWLRYFRCYDLRFDQGLEYGPIALRIYGTNKKRDNAEKAVLRVERVIRAAEGNTWPPIKPSR